MTSTVGQYNGLPLITNYTSDHYDGGIQNYSIIQDQRGLLYVGNNQGLLEFDGVSWNRYPVANSTKVRSVAVDQNGLIYAGAQNEFGYFSPNEIGQLVYNSLSSIVPSSAQNFGDVWRIYISGKSVYFCTSADIFKYENGSTKVITDGSPLELSFFANQELMTQKRGQGLFKLTDPGLESIANANGVIKDQLIADIIGNGKDQLLISTIENGLFTIGTEVESWSIGLLSRWKETKISRTLRLRNGNFAIGTQNGGVILVDREGEFISQLSKENGLNNRTVLDLYEDAQQNLWVAMANGIARIELHSPFSFIDEKVNLPGSGYAAEIHNDLLLLGTNTGLYLMGDGNTGDLSANVSTELIPNSEGQVYSLEEFNGQLLMGHHDGAFAFGNGQVNLIDGSAAPGWWKFLQIEGKPDVLVGGTYNGLYLLKFLDGQWNIADYIDGLAESSRVLEQDEDGAIWMSHGYKGVYKIGLGQSTTSITKLEFFDSGAGFPSDILINVFKIGKRVVFGTQSGIYRFDPTENRFVIDEFFAEILGNDVQVRELDQDSFGNIYFITEQFSGVIQKTATGSYELKTNLFKRIHHLLNDDLENIAILDDQNVLFGAKEGFIHYNPSQVFDDTDYANLLLRSVVVTVPNDSVLFSGNFFEAGKMILSQPEGEGVTLDYEHNSVKFSYAMTHLDGKRNADYKYQLVGFENDFSNWSRQSEKEYTNLREGAYEFKVVAQSTPGEDSNMVSFKFKVLPPWYRHFLAYVVYSILVAFLLVVLILAVRRRYKKQKIVALQDQQNEMDRKESEFIDTNRKSQEEIVILRNEKLKSEISHKNKELASSTMLLISKNEFISKVKNQLNTIATRSSINTEKELKKIAKDIDRNIASDQDWNQFEIHFDQVHGDFSRRLKATYPQLSNQDMKLCAFLKLNMSSKEIANLLNITVRGVELSRYRLRKKLDLDRSVNLADFILGF